MKSFQVSFLEHLESRIGGEYELVTQHSAANVLCVDFVIPGGFHSRLWMEAHFQRGHNVFEFNEPVMEGKSNPHMTIIGQNLSEADALMDAIMRHLGIE